MSCKVMDGLFMGDVDAAHDDEFLDLNRIKNIVNCNSSKIPNVFETNGIRYFTCDINEDNTNNIFFDLDLGTVKRAIRFINNAFESCDSVLVHCYNGTSDCVCIVLAFLMYKYEWSLDKTYEFVRVQQPEIRPNQNYIDQLYQLEKQMIKRDPKISQQKKWKEWIISEGKTSPDEAILVNTYNNIITTKHAIDKSKIYPIQCNHNRRLSWLDEKKDLSKEEIQMMKCTIKNKILPERPPNSNYSSMKLGQGWKDLFDNFSCSNSSSSIKVDETDIIERSVKHRPILKEQELEIVDDEKLDSNEQEDSWDLSYSDPNLSTDLEYQYQTPTSQVSTTTHAESKDDDEERWEDERNVKDEESKVVETRNERKKVQNNSWVSSCDTKDTEYKYPSVQIQNINDISIADGKISSTSKVSNNSTHRSTKKVSKRNQTKVSSHQNVNCNNSLGNRRRSADSSKKFHADTITDLMAKYKLAPEVIRLHNQSNDPSISVESGSKNVDQMKGNMNFKYSSSLRSSFQVNGNRVNNPAISKGAGFKMNRPVSATTNRSDLKTSFQAFGQPEEQRESTSVPYEHSTFLGTNTNALTYQKQKEATDRMSKPLARNARPRSAHSYRS